MSWIRHEQDDGSAVFINDDGEIEEIPQGEDGLGVVVRRRHHAHKQIKGWEKQQARYDGILLSLLPDKRNDFGTVMARVGGGTYPELNGEAFANMLYERFGAAFSQDSDAVSELLETIAAATGFRKPGNEAKGKPVLGLAALSLYLQCVTAKEKRPWIETDDILEEAPRR